MEDYIVRIVAALGMFLISWITERVTKLISTKIKNEKAQKYLSDVYSIVLNAVKSTYQEYVETLKDADMFNVDEQQRALEMAKEKIERELTEQSKKYIVDNFGDLNSWIINSIHSTLYDLKK